MIFYLLKAFLICVNLRNLRIIFLFINLIVFESAEICVTCRGEAISEDGSADNFNQLIRGSLGANKLTSSIADLP